MHAALEQLYDNNAVQYQLSDDTKFDDDFFDKVADEIFQMGGYSPDYLTTPNGSALIEETSRIFDNAINAGIVYEPDPELQSALSQNAFVFSGFKTDKELQEVAALLHGENGDIVPFDEFKQKVLAINQKYNVNYLQAEYNFAVQSAQMASKWKEFEKHKDFVNLQYRTASDERVREEHRALNNTTLPVDDPFWKEYLPPLGWNCRCTVVEVLKDLQPVSNSAQAIKAGQMATSKPAQKIFRFNPGQTQKLFPPKHPYLPKGNECKNCQLGDKIGLIIGASNKRICQTCENIKRLAKTKEIKKEIKKANNWDVIVKTNKEIQTNLIDLAKNFDFDGIKNIIMQKSNAFNINNIKKSEISFYSNDIKATFTNDLIKLSFHLTFEGNDPIFYLFSIKIGNEYQKKGISRLLLNFFIKESKQNKIKKFQMQTKEIGSFVWAKIGFYAKSRNHIIGINDERALKIINDYYASHEETDPFPMSLIASEPWGKEILKKASWFVDYLLE